jgi:hypothetical protein
VSGAAPGSRRRIGESSSSPVGGGAAHVSGGALSPTFEVVARTWAAALVIRDHNFNDMDVYAAGPRGARIRVGFAPGETTTRLPLPPSLVGVGTLRLTADPVGGFGAARTDPLVVTAGDTVTFTIEQDLGLSVATVR